jgi:Uma2 family endonuclease
MTTATRITAAQYYELTVEGDRKQLVDGQIVVDQPKLMHGLLQFRLAFELGKWIERGERRGLVTMPTNVAMDEYNVYGPDVLWFREERIPRDLNAYPEHVPDLCIEIRSPSTWRFDVGAKKRVYEAGGLPELWLVDDLSDTLLAYRRSEPGAPTFDEALEFVRGETLGSPMLPSFELSLEELFRR